MILILCDGVFKKSNSDRLELCSYMCQYITGTDASIEADAKEGL